MKNELRELVIKKDQSRTRKHISLFALTAIAAIVIAEALKQANANNTSETIVRNNTVLHSVEALDHDNVIEVNLSDEVFKPATKELSNNSINENSDATFNADPIDIEIPVENQSHTTTVENTADFEIPAQLSNEGEGFSVATDESSASTSSATGNEESSGVSPWAALGGVALLGGGIAVVGSDGDSDSASSAGMSTAGASPVVMEEEGGGDELNDGGDGDANPDDDGGDNEPGDDQITFEQRVCDALENAKAAGVDPGELFFDYLSFDDDGDPSALTGLEERLQGEYGMDPEMASEVHCH